MSEGSQSERGAEELSTLFAHLVIQQSNMAMMLLGKVAHPETGQVNRDLDAARLFIDQLEMLEVKTKGNLSKEESNLLGQSLMALRLAFVEAVDSEGKPTEPPSARPTEPMVESRPIESPPEEAPAKKFTKKY